ncbi:MAG: hypothetical protein ACPGQI_04900 [Gammaproteobacteria bacterium]
MITFCFPWIAGFVTCLTDDCFLYFEELFARIDAALGRESSTVEFSIRSTWT